MKTLAVILGLLSREIALQQEAMPATAAKAGSDREDPVQILRIDDTSVATLSEGASPSTSPDALVPSLEPELLFDEGESGDEVDEDRSATSLFDSFEVMDIPSHTVNLSEADLTEQHADTFPDVVSGSQLLEVQLSGLFRLVVVFEGGRDWHRHDPEGDIATEAEMKPSVRQNFAINARGGDRCALVLTLSDLRYVDGLWKCPSDYHFPEPLPPGHVPCTRGTRTVADFAEIVILDFIHTSHHRVLLEQFDPADIALRITLDVQNYGPRTEDLLDQSVTAAMIDVKPLRLFIDHNTLEFLVDFYTYSLFSSEEEPESSDAPEESPTPTGAGQFRHIELSRLDITVVCRIPRCLRSLLTPF
jgi:hypothetical protein